MRLSDDIGRRWRATVVRHLPVAVMEYAFECCMTLLGTVAGLGLLTGTFEPGSLMALLPPVVIAAYAVGLFTGAGTVLVGLVSRPRNPIIMAIGLRLVGLFLGIYGLAVLVHGGTARGGLAAYAFIAIGALAGLRSLFLRGTSEVAIRAHRKE